MKSMWEIKQQSEPGTLDLYIYGDVESDGYDWRTDEVIRSETSANAFREELAAHQNISQINIYINSYGGSVFEGTAIYNQLKRHPAHKTVYIDGFACSVASVIAMAGRRGDYAEKCSDDAPQHVDVRDRKRGRAEESGGRPG